MSERGLADAGCFQQPVVSEKQESDAVGAVWQAAHLLRREIKQMPPCVDCSRGCGNDD